MTMEERFRTFLDATPRIHATAFVAKGATVVGDVSIAAESSVWFGAVLRADIQSIRIGRGSNIQDGAIVHLANEFGVEVGDFVTVGHGAILHACTIGHEVLVGMRATVLDGAVIGDRCIIGAHTLITGNTVIPPGSMVMGAPGKITRQLSDREQDGLKEWATKYVDVSRRFLALGYGQDPAVVGKPV